MAIFVFIAWTIQLLEAIGLVETEASDPGSKAYRRSHAGLQFLKEHLQGHQLEQVESCELHLSGGVRLIAQDGRLVCGGDEFLLGEGGGATFFRSGEQHLGVHLWAQEDGGEHRLQVSLKQEFVRP